MSEYRRHLAYTAGKKAGLSGKPKTENNRERGTIFFDDWCDGWSDGERQRSSLSDSDGTASAALCEDIAVPKGLPSAGRQASPRSSRPSSDKERE